MWAAMVDYLCKDQTHIYYLPTTVAQCDTKEKAKGIALALAWCDKRARKPRAVPWDKRYVYQ
jgi:hypothetical protein